jgi:hypothetical protein
MGNLLLIRLNVTTQGMIYPDICRKRGKEGVSKLSESVRKFQPSGPNGAWRHNGGTQAALHYLEIKHA